MRRAVLSVGVLLCLLLACRALYGDEPRQESAKELYERASVQFRLGQFHAAALTYQSVYELHHDASLLYNIAQAYRLAGDDDKAVFFYRSYLSDATNPPNRGEVDTRIADLQRKIDARKREQPQLKPVQPEATPAPSVTARTEAAVVTSAPAARHRPIYRKWWLWTVIGVVAAGAVVGVAVGLTHAPPSYPSANVTDGPVKF